jgi:hypothetical protein
VRVARVHADTLHDLIRWAHKSAAAEKRRAPHRKKGGGR